MAKVLFIIAKQGFRDKEYFIPKKILENAKHKIKTASNCEAGEIAVGADNSKVKIDLNIKNVKVDDFRAIIFIGGPGALENLDNEQSYQIANKTVAQNKLLAAICVAPTILAKAGILKGKKAAVWSSLSDKSGIKTLKNNGAEFIDKNVVQDGNIITAHGPKAAQEFGEKIANYLSTEE
ncbi:MAG: DJ-1/PfpI family protein [Patescibacteria group bacterium]